MQDPWQKMAIQEQFSQQVENQEVGYPATLAYLEQTMEQRWSELDQSDRGGGVWGTKSTGCSTP